MQNGTCIWVYLLETSTVAQVDKRFKSVTQFINYLAKEHGPNIQVRSCVGLPGAPYY